MSTLQLYKREPVEALAIQRRVHAPVGHARLSLSRLPETFLFAVGPRPEVQGRTRVAAGKTSPASVEIFSFGKRDVGWYTFLPGAKHSGCDCCGRTAFSCGNAV